jgi:hypothetical protein
LPLAETAEEDLLGGPAAGTAQLAQAGGRGLVVKEGKSVKAYTSCCAKDRE